MQNHFDAIVIGTGIGGLTAGLNLANKGKSVLLLEAAKSYGGYLNPFSRKGFHFDPGLHYVGQAGASQDFRLLLDELGLEDITFNELSPDGFDWFSFPEYSIKFGRGLDDFRQKLKKDFPKEAGGIDKFINLIEQVDKILKTLRSIKRPLQALKALPYFPLVIRYGKATLKDILDRCVKDPNLRGVLSGPCGDAGLPPSRLSGLGHLAILNHYKEGGYYPHGGTEHMMAVYLKRLQEKGVELKNRARVVKILHGGDKVQGVEIESGERFFATTIVSNAQGVDTYKMIGDDCLKKSQVKKIQRLENSLASFMVFLGVDEKADVTRVKDNNVWHYSTTDIDKLYNDLLDGKLPDGGGMFINIPSLKDPSGKRAPDGHHAVELVTLCAADPFKKWFGQKVKRREEDYNRLKEDLSLKLIAEAEKYIPGLSRSVVIKEVGTPATNHSYVNCPDGNVYGPALTPNQVGPFRFSRRFHIKGLYLAGASTDSAGIYPCAVSGKIAGSLANKYLEGK